MESLRRAPAFLTVQTKSQSNPFSLCLTPEVMLEKSARPSGNWTRHSSAWSDLAHWVTFKSFLYAVTVTILYREGPISCCRGVPRWL